MLPFLKIVSEIGARFPTQLHIGYSERGPSPFQLILILSFIHVRTPDKQYRRSELSYLHNPNRGPFPRKP